MLSFCPQFWFSTNHHWSSFIHCFWYVWNQLINFGHHFLYVRSRFFFSIVNPRPGFLWFFFSIYKLSVSCFKMFGTLNWFKRPETWDPFFMKFYFIFLTYFNPLSMPSSLNFFKSGRESKVHYIKNYHFVIIFWPLLFFLLNLIWHQGF